MKHLLFVLFLLTFLIGCQNNNESKISDSESSKALTKTQEKRV